MFLRGHSAADDSTRPQMTARTPNRKANVSGAALRNPKRYAGRTIPTRTRPLGAPYACMTQAQCAAWTELAAKLPWLHSAHRTLVRLACIWIARGDDCDLDAAAASVLATLLAKMGATPTTRR